MEAIRRVDICLVLYDRVVGILPTKHDWQSDSGDLLDSIVKTDHETEPLLGEVQVLEHATESTRCRGQIPTLVGTAKRKSSEASQS